MRFSQNIDDVFADKRFSKIDQLTTHRDPKNHPRAQAVETTQFRAWVDAVKFDVAIKLTIGSDPSDVPVALFQVKLPVLIGAQKSVPALGVLGVVIVEGVPKEMEIKLETLRKVPKSLDVFDAIGIEVIDSACDFFPDALLCTNTAKKLRYASLKSASDTNSAQISNLLAYLDTQGQHLREGFTYIKQSVTRIRPSIAR